MTLAHIQASVCSDRRGRSRRRCLYASFDCSVACWLLQKSVRSLSDCGCSYRPHRSPGRPSPSPRRRHLPHHIPHHCHQRQMVSLSPPPWLINLLLMLPH